MIRRIRPFGRQLARSRLASAAPTSTTLQLSARSYTTPSPSTRPIHHALSRRVALVVAHRNFHSSPIARADEPFKLADIGEGITEVEIISWSVKEGDMVEEFDTLCEVQSDKSTVELTAPFTGKIHHIAFGSGEMVKVGQILCRITTDGGASGDVPAAPPPTEEASPLEPPVQHDPPSPVPVIQADGMAEPPSHPPQPSQRFRAAPPEFTSDPITTFNDGKIPPPPPRQIVRPVEDASERTSALDRALLASLRAAAEAGDAVEAATEAVELLQSRDASMESAGQASFSGEAAMVRGHEPRKVEVRTEPVPERRERPEREGRRDIVKTSPAVRTLAARLGVKLEDVKPTGEGGRVTQQDVQGAAGGQNKAVGESSRATQGVAPAAPSRPALPYPAERSKIPEITKVEFGRTRKVMYRAMGDMAHVPHFGYSHTLNLTPLLPYIRALNAPPASPSTNYIASDIPAEHARNPVASAAAQKTTLLSFLVKGLLLAMEEHPIMRARAKEQGSSRFLEIARDGVIGVAVSDPKYGLVTPSLPHLPPSTSLSALTSALTQLRLNPTKPSSPANLTISSVGGLGEGRDMMPVLPPGGGVAICAVGRARWEMEWKNASGKGIMEMTPEEVEKGGSAAVLRCPVGWSGDHRVLEGAELIAFTETWKKYIEEPWRWLKVD